MNTAFVKILGELVGAVALDEATGYATFEYDAAFKRKGWELAPLQMPVSTNKSSFSFPALRKKAAEIIDDISHIVNQWKTFADEVKVSPTLRDEIAATLIRW